VESSPSAQPAAGVVRAALFEYRGATDAGRVHPLHTGRNTLGRDEGCSVVLSDGRVSSQHGYLFIRAEDATYVDVSTNGSVVEGRVVHGEQVVLQNHAVLKLGETTLVLVIVPDSVLARHTR
jgi:pSer/pThr/pTyr-binding forkhead associated (FHA) protein